MNQLDDLTALLRRWSAGDRDALDRLLPLVYSELKRIAAARLRRESPGHSLQSAALVKEVLPRYRMAGSCPLLRRRRSVNPRDPGRRAG